MPNATARNEEASREVTLWREEYCRLISWPALASRERVAKWPRNLDIAPWPRFRHQAYHQACLPSLQPTGIASESPASSLLRRAIDLGGADINRSPHSEI